jgi:hypothetical protein
MVVEKVFYRDTKPYHTPKSLASLKGPSCGLLDLPHSVFWSSERSVNLDVPGGIPMAYQAILSEGTPKEQESLLNEDVLCRYWGELVLPVRVRTLWETRFPVLRG